MDYLGSKLRSLRRSKSLSLKQLAERASCSPSYLSMVENGKVDPGISRLKRIADGLEITIVDLFQTETNQKVAIKTHERISAEFPRSKTKIEILIPQSPENQLDARLATIYPGGNSEGEYKHPGEEFGLVLKGILELVVDGVIYKLVEGDSFHFSSTRSHRFSNPGGQETLVVWVNHPPSF
jgi:transcriptional regulator with XRE-family HTH domain